MSRNAGRIGPTATRAGGGIWSIPEHYQKVRGGEWLLPSVSGGVVTSDATYSYRAFYGNGTLEISGGPISVDVLVVGGGGGGGRQAGGGGGAGGYLTSSNLSLAAGLYQVVVGAGGPAMTSTQTSPAVSNGGDSTAFGLTAIGGGGGGGHNNGINGATFYGANGGSGGGGWSTAGKSTGTPGQGNGGGNGTANGSYYSETPGGGGGAGAAGADGSSSSSGAGGGGLEWVNGTTYAGGGGSGGPSSGSAANTYGVGGAGGGGRGGQRDSVNGTSGSSNTGGGGGGSSYSSQPGTIGVPGNGGSGVVILRYLSADVALPVDSWEVDELSAYLKIALPLNTVLGTNDYSAEIRGSGVSRVTTAVNGPAISATQSKFYGSSLDNGTESQDKYISIPNSQDLALGTNNFCIEGWWYPTTNTTGYHVLASHSGDTVDQQNGWVLLTETNNTLYFYASDSGGWDVPMGGAFTPSANTWHHIAVTRSGTTFRLFVNGTQVNTVTSSANITLPTSREFRLGSYRYIPGYPQSFNGFIQDFRMYIGNAKYTSNFTPPTAMYIGG